MPDEIADAQPVVADDQPVITTPAKPNLNDLTVEELQDRADQRGIEVAGTGAAGRVLKSDLIAALDPVSDLPPDPRQQADKHPLAAAAEHAAESARVRDRTHMFPTVDQE